MNRLFRLVAEWPWMIVLGVFAVTALAAFPLVDFEQRRFRIAYDMSTNRLLPEDAEGRVFWDYVRKAFGSDETMIVAVSSEDVFTHESLSRIQRIADRIARLDGVHHVIAITNAANVRGSEDGIDIRPFVKQIPTDPAALAELRQQALANPIYAGNLISTDGRTAAMVVQFLNHTERDFIDKGLDDAIQAIADEEATPEIRVFVTGAPHLKAAQARYQIGDLVRSMPMIALAIAVVLAISFRTVRGVVLPLFGVSVALVWTFGVMAWLGRPLTIVTFLVPPMLLILGVAYSVHVIAEFYDLLREDAAMGARKAVEGTLRLVWFAVLLTGLTTVAGFLSNTLSPIAALVEFGWLSVVGVLATLVVALTLTPALLAILGRPRRLAASEVVSEHGRFARLIEWLAAFDLRNRKAIFLFWTAVMLVSVLAGTRLVVGNQSVRFLPETSRPRLDFEAVNTSLDGANGFQVVVEARDKATFKQPVNLRALESLQQWLDAQPEIGGSTGLVDFVKLMNRAFHADDPAHLAVPENERLTGQLLFLGASDELEGYVDARYQLTNIQVRMTILDSALVSDLVKRVEARLAELPPQLHGRATGYAILMNGVVNDLIWGQMTSIAGSLVLIYGLLWLMFLSARIGFVALIPNVIPVAVYFGALGFTGITLNFATSIIAPMALGVAIDDTIHYFTRFKVEAKRLADEERATVSVLRSVGRPVIYSTVSLVAGFMMLSWSDLLSWQQVGGMAAFTLAFSLFVEVTLTPALCSGLRIVTLWDSLTLDLGADPQMAIPLFKGLSKTQCRIVAQMASLRELAAGTPLARIDEKKSEMYAIVDGTVRVWKPGDDGHDVELRTCGRGDVVGEVGLFSGVRSANMDVAAGARVLRFTPNNLLRLRRWYPRTAAIVLRNLNEILAQRLASLTVRLTS